MDITKTISAIVILSADGQRTLSKTFDSQASGRQFERQLYARTKLQRVKDEIIMVDGLLVIHKFVTGLHLYVAGQKNSNPLVLDLFLKCLAEVISALLEKNSLSIYDRLSQVILAIDEMCDEGLVLETDSNLVIDRLSLKTESNELTITQKLQSATGQFKFPWIRS